MRGVRALSYIHMGRIGSKIAAKLGFWRTMCGNTQTTEPMAQ